MPPVFHHGLYAVSTFKIFSFVVIAMRITSVIIINHTYIFVNKNYKYTLNIC